MTLIERVGSRSHKIPHITAREIIERNIQLKQALSAANSASKNQIMKRAFTTAWASIREHTDISVFTDIQIPDPKKGEGIPTMTTLDMLYEFRHGGKKSYKQQK